MAPVPRPESVFRGNVAVLSVSVACAVMAGMIWYPVLPLYYRDLQATDYQVSVAYGLLVIVGSFVQLAGGYLSDRFGRKPLIVVPTFINAAVVLAAGFSSSWAALTAFVVTQNAAGALQMPSFLTIIAETVPPERQGDAYALLELFVSLGLGLGPALGAVLLPRLPFRGLFAVSAAIYLAVAVVRAVALRETRPRMRTQARRAAAPDPLPLPLGARPAFSPGALFRGRLLWLAVTAVAVAVGVNVTVYGPFIPLLLHDALSLSKRQIDVLYSVGPLVAAALGLAMGRFVARRGPGPAVAWGLGGAGVCLIALLVAPTFGWALALMTGAGVFLQLNFIGYDTLRAVATTPEMRGRVVGALGALGGVVGALSVPLVGKWAETAGPGLACWVGAVFCAAGAGSAIVAERWGSRDEPALGER
ncbi:MAG: MFS transporter [Bacillota bacterium]|nr:MAG: MFS transporter [Bacillota bacterium]